jgi:hypothetical protein
VILIRFPPPPSLNRTFANHTAGQNEFDKYFPVETNTGDLNLPDFDFSQFTGVVGFDNNNTNTTTTNNASIPAPASSASHQQPLDASNTTMDTTASAITTTTNNNNNHSSHGQRGSQDQQAQREDLSDVNFSAMSFFPPGPGTYLTGTDPNSRNRNP